MLQLLADENFNNNIIRGVLRRLPTADIVRVQDVGLSGVDDPTVLGWAANNNRILLTHDVTTITKYAYARIEAGQVMPGVFEINSQAPLGIIIDDIVLLIESSLSNEWAEQIIYLPL